MRAAAVACALLLAGCAAGADGTGNRRGDLHDMPVRVVAGEEVWEERVEVDRIVIVRRGGHLIVRPGTRVLFRRVDWDGDGIGDAEITVEGRLTAVGTATAPILFASAETDPAPGDWKYLHVNFAEGAQIAFARVSDAFSGLQVHYAEASVTRSEFRHNVDGVRFSTARLAVDASWIRQNRNGVRFEERGHPARVVGSDISANEVGIFAVTGCGGRSEFSGNDIVGNAVAVKLGTEQREDLAFPGNWWGDTQAAEATIVDRRLDSQLGRVTIAPALERAAQVPRPFPIPADPDWSRVTARDN